MQRIVSGFKAIIITIALAFLALVLAGFGFIFVILIAIAFGVSAIAKPRRTRNSTIIEGRYEVIS